MSRRTLTGLSEPAWQQTLIRSPPLAPAPTLAKIFYTLTSLALAEIPRKIPGLTVLAARTYTHRNGTGLSLGQQRDAALLWTATAGW